MKCQMCKALTPFPGSPHISISFPSSMRLIRAHLLPNPNHGLRKLLRPLVGELCEGGRCSAGISRHRCGRFLSTVALASSSADDAKDIQRGKKKLPIHERRILVESFVNEYRTLNAGKFPSITAAQKEVGGSFYVIREILQDLEYNFVHNPGVGMTGKSLVENKGAEDVIMPEEGEFLQAEEVSFSHSGGESHLFVFEKDPNAEVEVFTSDMQVLSDKVQIEVKKTGDLEVETESTGFKENEVEVKKTVDAEVETDSTGFKEVEVEVKKTVDAEVETESTGFKEIKIEVKETVESEVETESTGLKEVDGQSLSGGLVGDVSADQKIMCEKSERVSFVEHPDHLSDDEINKNLESREMLERVSFSEKTSLEDTSNSRSKEDKDELVTRSDSLEAEGSSSMPLTGEPVLVKEMAAKSSQDFVNPNISTSSLTDDQKSPNYDALREISTENSKDNDPQANPSIWNSLKSFVDSIFSIWRKR